MPSTLQVNKIIDGSATTNKELAEYASGNWSWGSGVPNDTLIQIKIAEKTGFQSSTKRIGDTDPWVEITDLSVDITPKSNSNKILVIATVCGQHFSNTAFLAFKVLRNGSDTVRGDARGSSTRIGAGISCLYNVDANAPPLSASQIFLDSPSSTSQLTYKVYATNVNSTTSSTWAINGSNNSGANYNSSSQSSITVIEVKA
tara:strand:- start:295 stop:897 length:603 start_codon:yes stop_codon:yes gene_type:complete